jgi:hypothetical protein
MAKTMNISNQLDDLLSLPRTEADLPPENETVGVYADFLTKLLPSCVLLDAKLGWMAWVKGTVFNRADASEKVSAEEYDALVGIFGYADSTVRHYRRIASKYRFEDVQGKTQSELRRLATEPKPATDKGGQKGNGQRLIKITLKNLSDKLTTAHQIVLEAATVPLGTSMDDVISIYDDAAKKLADIIDAASTALTEIKNRQARETGLALTEAA